jgi:glutaryl-CoA dehydrogenase
MSAPTTKSTDNPCDFLGLETLLDDDERAIAQTVRRFVAELVLPDIAKWYEQGVFPREMAKEMGNR